MDKALEKTQQALEDYQKVSISLQNFGSTDSEPRWVAQDCIKDIMAGRRPVIPNTANGWQLYCSMEGSEDAAERLHQAMQKCEDAINNVRLRYRNELFEVVSKYFYLER